MDIIGIGIGPSNLSLAALLHPIPHLSSIFLEKQKTFHWHQGMQLPFAQMQVSYLKDLVTLIDPQNPLSFLSFLSSQKRLYQFINANFQQVSRAEFTQYYHWACQQLSSKLCFNSEVKEISIVNKQFVIKTEDKNLTGSHLVLGTGLTAYIPPFAQEKISNTVIHSSTFLERSLHYRQQKVAVIGGGQSSAEIILHLLADQEKLPQRITWITSRNNFLPLDNSPFVNETFTPNYSNYFHALPPAIRKHILHQQKLSSDGISLSTLEDIYRKLYNLNFLNYQKNRICLMPETQVINMEKNWETWGLHLRNVHTDNKQWIDADIVILCTGYTYLLPEFLDAITDNIHRDPDGNILVNDDFSLQGHFPAPCKIFIQNGARHSKGIADPNLSLTAWRSALIINSIAKQKIYNTDDYPSFIHWENPSFKH